MTNTRLARSEPRVRKCSIMFTGKGECSEGGYENKRSIEESDMDCFEETSEK